MRKFILGAILALIGASSAMAQTSDYKKAEFFAGYSNNQVNLFTNPYVNGNSRGSSLVKRTAFHGFNASAVYNVSRYFGIKADISGTYRNKRFSSTVTSSTTSIVAGFDTNNSLYNFLGGVQIKDNSAKTRVKPFAHALIGAGHGRTKISNSNCPSGAFCIALSSANDSETGLAGALGGGLDVKVSDRIDIRAIQIDYNPIRFNGNTSHNVRFGVGIVIK